MKQGYNKHAAEQDAKFFNAVISQIPKKASKLRVKVNGINDCIDRTVTIIGFNTAICKIKGIYGKGKYKCFEMYTKDGIRHNLRASDIYYKNTLRTEINAII